MSIVVLAFGKSALRENSCGELVRLFGSMQRLRAESGLPALARKFSVAIRRFLDDDVRDEQDVSVAMLSPPISRDRLLSRDARPLFSHPTSWLTIVVSR